MKRNKAQSTLEYAVIIACIVGALLAMGVYVKRGMQGRLRQTADDLGQQYSPKFTTGSFTLTSVSDTETISETKSEKELNRDCDGKDSDNDGFLIDNNVYCTEVTSKLVDDGNLKKGAVTTQTGNETVQELSKESLF